MTVLINLPQRIQAVDGVSPFDAGVRLLPLLLSSPVATALAGQLATKLKVPPFYLTMFATSLQMLGIGLCSSVPFRGSSTTIYGYEVLMGFGFGMGLVSLLIYAPLVVDREDLGEIPRGRTPIRPWHVRIADTWVICCSCYHGRHYPGSCARWDHRSRY